MCSLLASGLLLAGKELSLPPDKQVILQLAREHKFTALEAYFDGLYENYEQGRAREAWLLQAYHAFYNSDPQLLDHLNLWVAERPDSYHAAMGRGGYFVHLGWLYRDGKWFKDTAIIQRRGMEAFLKRALTDMQRAAELRPTAFLPYSHIIGIHGSLGEDESFWNAVDEGLKRNPASFLLRKEILFNLQPKWGGSIRQINSFIEDTKKWLHYNHELKQLLGYGYYVEADILDNKDRAAAQKLYDRALGLGESAFLFKERGRNLYYMRKYQQSLEDFDRALALYPQYVWALRDKGWALFYMKRYQEAGSVFAEAIKYDLLDPDVNYGMARSLAKQEKYQQAVSFFEVAIGNFGAHEKRIFNNYGYMLIWDLKDYQRGKKILKRAIDLDRENTSNWINYATALNALLDCDVIGVMKTYLALCESQGTCSEANIDWAKDNINGLIKKNFCSDQKAVFRP